MLLIRLLQKSAFVFAILVFVTMASADAQAPVSPVKNKDSYFKAAANYLTNSVYYGRKDSLPYPYLTASLGYFDKSGFYITGSLSYLLQANQNRIDVGAIDAGYTFSFSDRFSADVYGNKSWYRPSSGVITSDITGTIGSLLSYDLSAVQLNGGIDLTFASKTDIGLNLGLSHSFTLGKEGDQWQIEPSFSTNWSTLHSYEGYVNRKLGKKPGAPGGATTTAVTSVQNNKLTLLDYEIWVPVIYETKRFGFMFTPTLAIPRNPIYTTTTITTRLAGGAQTTSTINSTPVSETTLANSLYAEFEFFIKF
ncbi:MAG: hypothetical protein V4539_19485 [Bacteroidota bacterium]